MTQEITALNQRIEDMKMDGGNNDLQEFFDNGDQANSGSRREEYLDIPQNATSPFNHENQEFISRSSRRYDDYNLPQDIIMSTSQYKQSQPFEYGNSGSRSRASGTFLDQPPLEENKSPL